MPRRSARHTRPRPIAGSLDSIRTQVGRQWSVRTPLGPDAMLLEWFRGREEISRIHGFELGLLSETSGIPARSLLGREATVRLALPGGGARFFSGVVSSLVEEPGWDDLAAYRMTVVPWLWLLTRSHDCRIFQDMTVPEILADTFRRHGMGSFDFRLSRERGTKREYCVQYRESAFNFVSRLMEEEGIAYHIEHHEDHHVLVLTDSAGSRTAFPGYEAVPLGNEQGSTVSREHAWDVSAGQEIRPGAYASTDYNFMNPRDNLQARTNRPLGHAHSGFEVFDYPGRYHLYPTGELSTKIRLLELQSGHAWVQGASDARGLAAGRTVTLAGRTAGDRRQLLIVSAEYEGRGDGFDSGEGSTDRAAAEGMETGEVFRCRFTGTPANEEYLPAQTTPKPTIQGPQTAMVVGHPNKEIDVDQYGRIKVHFHWDRHQPQDHQNSSCRIRVCQPWAGLSYGGLAIPRIGHEVVVEFMEGDPDRPLITGRVYNASRKVPISGAGKDLRQRLRKIAPPLKPPPHPAAALRALMGAVPDALQSTRPDAASGAPAGSIASTSSEPKPEPASRPGAPSMLHASLQAGNAGTAPAGAPAWQGRSAAARLFEGPRAAGDMGAPGKGSPRPGGIGGSLLSVGSPMPSGDGADEDVNPPDSIENAAQLTTIRSNSLGKTGGCNEITMDDTSGKEGLFLKAQHDEMHTVGHDQFVNVANNRTTEVGVDSLEKIGNDMSLEVGQNAQETVGVAKVVDVGSTLLIRAGTSITLQCGASTIHMNQAGFITISGSVVSIAGTVNTNMTAPVTNVTGAMLLTLTGAVNLSLGAVCRTQAATLASINSVAQAEVVAGADAVVKGSNVKLN